MPRRSARIGCFAARVENVVAVASLLKSVAFDEKVNVFVDKIGLKFTVEEGKCVQASVLIPKASFLDFHVAEEDVSFKIPFKELLDCLKVFYSDSRNESLSETASHTSMRLSYEAHGSPFVLQLEESGVVTDFQLRTEECDDLMTFQLDPIICKVILRSDHMSDLLTEIEGNSPETVQIEVPLRGPVKISGIGLSGNMEVTIPIDSSVVESFECSNAISGHYSFPILRYAFKALNLSQVMALKMDPSGILSLSFLMPTKSDSFVEFYCIPKAGEDDDDDDF